MLILGVFLFFREIVDNTGKENGIDLIMSDRTYHLIAESPEDASQWFSVLSQVHASTEQEIREMHDEQANPQNAVVSLNLKNFSNQVFLENRGTVAATASESHHLLCLNVVVAVTLARASISLVL